MQDITLHTPLQKAWMRELEVILTSKDMKKKMIFGSNWKEGKNDLNIEVTGYKYLSALKDNFTIRISNLTYKEVIQIMQGKYYDVEIKAGYRSKGAQTIFKGSVIYISNEYGDRKTHTIIILCGSNVIAKYGQSRMNLSLSSGINMYNAIQFICKKAGIKNSNVDESFKTKFINDLLQVKGTVGSFFEEFAKSNDFITSTSSEYGSDIILLNPYRNVNRIVKLDSNNITLIGGYPTLNSDGLRMTLLPTFNFMPTDGIQIDNSLIDLSVQSIDTSQFIKTNFLDKDGVYVIYQIEYNLSNRGSAFSITVSAKSRSIYSNLLGGTK